MKRCSKNECCKQSRYVKFKGTTTNWPVQKSTHRTTQKHKQHVEHQDATAIKEKTIFVYFSVTIKNNNAINFKNVLKL